MKLQRTRLIRTLSIMYLVIFIALALYDEPLQKDIAEFLKVPPVTLSDAENAYFAQLGFAAPHGVDIHRYGMEKYRSVMDESAKRHAGGIQPPPSKQADSAQLTFTGKELPKDRFWQFVTDRPPALEVMARDNAELLARYHGLLRYRHIAEPGGNGHYQDVPFPEFLPIRSTHTLSLLLILRTAQQGKLDQALSELSDDMKYWRVMLRQSHVLIGKLIAIACIQKDYQVLSELIAHFALSDSQRSEIRALLPPWNADDVNFAEASRYEALYVTESMFASLPQQGMLNGLLLKRNATTNTIVRIHLDNGRIAQLSPEELVRSMSTRKNSQKELARLHPDFLYNPVGAILSAIAVPQLSSYFSRFHDLEAKRRMVLIHLMAKEQGVGHDGMDAFLKKSGKGFANPYTGQPMRWHTGKQSIVIDSVASEAGAEQRRVELPL